MEQASEQIRMFLRLQSRFHVMKPRKKKRKKKRILLESIFTQIQCLSVGRLFLKVVALMRCLQTVNHEIKQLLG